MEEADGSIGPSFSRASTSNQGKVASKMSASAFTKEEELYAYCITSNGKRAALVRLNSIGQVIERYNAPRIRTFTLVAMQGN